MTQKTLLVDQDGVLTGDWQDRFNYHFADRFPHINAPFLAENTDWNLTNGLDQEGIEAVREVLMMPGFYADLKPAEGSAEALEQMLAAGYNVYICTTPYVLNPTCASDKIAWAEKHYGAGWGRRMILSSDKTAVRGDYLFDDKPLIKGEFVPTWEHILVDQPYNTSIKDGRRRISSIANWQTALDIPSSKNRSVEYV